jgi:hypothetical protein
MEEYGFLDFRGIGDTIGMALGGNQFDSLTNSSAVTWLRARGRFTTRMSSLDY